jgi:hypothetical protein
LNGIWKSQTAGGKQEMGKCRPETGEQRTEKAGPLNPPRGDFEWNMEKSNCRRETGDWRKGKEA